MVEVRVRRLVWSRSGDKSHYPRKPFSNHFMQVLWLMMKFGTAMWAIHSERSTQKPIIDSPIQTPKTDWDSSWQEVSNLWLITRARLKLCPAADKRGTAKPAQKQQVSETNSPIISSPRLLRSQAPAGKTASMLCSDLSHTESAHTAASAFHPC